MKIQALLASTVILSCNDPKEREQSPEESQLNSSSQIKWNEPKNKNDPQLKQLPFILPDGISEVYFAEYSAGMQEYKMFLRFSYQKEKETKDIISFLRNENLKRSTKKLPAASKPPPSLTSIRIPSELEPLLWWKSDNEDFDYYGTDDSYSLRIWIDKKNNRIFIYSSD